MNEQTMAINRSIRHLLSYGEFNGEPIHELTHIGKPAIPAVLRTYKSAPHHKKILFLIFKAFGKL